jgi:hypothetical protein
MSATNPTPADVKQAVDGLCEMYDNLTPENKSFYANVWESFAGWTMDTMFELIQDIGAGKVSQPVECCIEMAKLPGFTQNRKRGQL